MARSRDHTVPIMYLRRFAEGRDQARYLIAAPATDLSQSFRVSPKNVAVQTDFYWGTDPEGVAHHDLEAFLGRIENQGAPAFRALLDSGRLPTDDAFPDRWPVQLQTRLGIAWWVAAQILRTDRQRQRLLATVPTPSTPIHEPRVNQHLRYIVELIAPLAAMIFGRPWGIGFTSLCLLSSDTPVVILNGLDDNDQLRAAQFWDIYLPLDPHRMLFLPGFLHRGNVGVLQDHKFNLPGGLAIALNNAMREAAFRHVFFHPSHDPTQRVKDPRLMMAHEVDTPAEYVVNYRPMPQGLGVERQWLERHVERGLGRVQPRSEEDVLAAAKRLVTNLRTAQDAYQGSDDRSGPMHS